MYVVRFVRVDQQPIEEYFYHNLCDALVHLKLFDEDTSELYSCIQVVEIQGEQELEVLEKRF